MKVNATLSAIFNRPWAIEPAFAEQAGSVVAAILAGTFVPSIDKSNPTSTQDGPPKYDMDEDLSFPSYAIAFSASGNIVKPSYYSKMSDAPDGSIAVIPFKGALMKADNCGDPGTASRNTQLEQAGRLKNIAAVILHMDSPGGTVDGTETSSNTIKSVRKQKPVVTFVDGMMCSAALWIGCSSDEVIAGLNSDVIGSIGTYCSFADLKPMWEKKGVKFHEVYADASTEKNEDIKEAKKGNYGPIKEEINALNDDFIAAVQANRPGVNPKVFKGKTFRADKALKMGLIDDIGNFNYAIQRAQELAVQQSNFNQNNTLMKNGTPVANNTATEDTAPTAQELQSLQEELAQVKEERDQLKAERTEQATVIDKTLTQLGEMRTAQESFQKDIEALKKTPAYKGVNTAGEESPKGDAMPGDAANTPAGFDPNSDHNKDATARIKGNHPS